MGADRDRSHLGLSLPLPHLGGRTEHFYPPHRRCRVPTAPVRIRTLSAPKYSASPPGKVFPLTEHLLCICARCFLPRWHKLGAARTAVSPAPTPWGQGVPSWHWPLGKYPGLAVSNLPGWTPCPLPGFNEP